MNDFGVGRRASQCCSTRTSHCSECSATRTKVIAANALRHAPKTFVSQKISTMVFYRYWLYYITERCILLVYPLNLIILYCSFMITKLSSNLVQLRLLTIASIYYVNITSNSDIIELRH